MSDTHAEMVDKNKAFTLASWTTQDSWNPISMDRAEGVYFWDADGKRYIDWASQLFNVNIGRLPGNCDHAARPPGRDA
jgi:taurine--2-oxoglutarate transaminase